MLTICTWLWGEKYGPQDVAKLAAGVRHHLEQPHRFICIMDDDLHWDHSYPDEVIKWPIVDCPLTTIPGCFVRLRIFHPKSQKAMGISAGDRIACIDLDSVITGQLDPLFDRPEQFVILQGANASNPCPYNGSLMMLRAGAYPEVWSDFSIEAASKIPFYEFPDDQGWIAHKVPNAAGWKAGAESGVYAFQKPGWPRGDALPADARMVVFPGWRSPEKFKHLPWIKQHWRA